MPKEDFKHIERPWGYFVNIYSGDGFLIKMLSVNPGAQLSYQSHRHRAERWFVVTGTARVIVEDTEYIMHKSDILEIDVGEKHSLQNPYDEPLIVLELQMGDILSEDDITRYSDIYGRA